MTDMVVKRIRAMSKGERFALVERTIQESGAYDFVCRAYDTLYGYYAFITVSMLSFSMGLSVLDFLSISIIALASDVLFIAFENKRTNRLHLVDSIISGYTIPRRLKIKGFLYKFTVAFPILAFVILLYSMAEHDLVDGWPWLIIFGIYILALCAMRLFLVSMRMPSVRALSCETNADQELEEFSLEKLAKGDHKVIIYRYDVRYPEFMLIMGFLFCYL